jgi:hypothetical protein
VALVVLFLGGPLLLAYYGLFLTTPIRDQQLHDHGRTVEATVVAVLGAPLELHDAERAAVRFSRPDGSTAVARLDVGAGERVGDRVGIVYDPTRPSVAVLPFQARGSALSRFLAPVATLVVLLAGIPALALVSARRRRRRSGGPGRR